MNHTTAEAPTKPQPLPYTPEVAARVDHLYERVKDVVPPFDWPGFAPEIDAILRLKAERNAIVLAHNYQTPEIYHGVADIVGDSLALARKAMDTDADVIVMAGVHFMAETTKLTCPEKTVLMPDMAAGCSLAESITGADVRALRQAYPGVPIVTYVNTSAEVKAESDICCTSGNAVKIVESLGVDKVICLPDEFLADYVAQRTKVQVIKWKGRCEVHERFSGDDIRAFRDSFDSLVVVAHPECPPDVIKASDFTGSTADMIAYVQDRQPQKVLLLTECSMSDNIAGANPGVEFMRPCGLCPHMKRISLSKIRRALETMTPEVIVDPEVAERARAAVDRMLAVK